MRWFSPFLAPEGDAAAGGAGAGTVQESALDAVQDRLATLRSSLTEGGRGITMEEGQPRDDTGKFRSPTAEAAAAALGEGEEPPAGDGEEPPAGDETPPEGELEGAAGEGEGEGTGEEAPPEGGEGEEEGADPRLTVTLRPREPGGEPVTVTVQSIVEADALRRNIAEGMRREEFNARVNRLAEREATLAAFERLADVDPVSLVLDHVHTDHHAALALHLLSDPKVFQQVAEQTTGWDDENARRAAAAEMRAERMTRRPEVEREVQRSLAVQRVVQSVEDGIDEVAQQVPEELREQFLADAARDMQEHIKRHQVRQPMTAEEVKTALAARRRLYGIAEGSPAAPGTRSGARSPRPRGSEAERLAAKASSKTGADFVKGARQRRDVASGSPGAGVTHTPPVAAPPKDQGLKERFAYVRQLMGK